MFAARSTSLLFSRRIPTTNLTNASVRHLRSTSKNIPPSSPTPDAAPETTPSSSSSSTTSPLTQGEQTPSSSDLPPLESQPTQTPTSAEPPTEGASQVPPPPPQKPVDALATRSTSIAEAFLDLHPDVQPRSEESKFGDRTGAKAQGASKSSVERKRQNLTRSAIIGTLLGVGYYGYEWGKEWESDDERKKFAARSDDKDAVEMAEKSGWEGFIGRLRLRGADQLDVRSRFSSTAW